MESMTVSTLRISIPSEPNIKFCHNMGVSKRPNSMYSKDELIIGYAYSDGGQENWGKWAIVSED